MTECAVRRNDGRKEIVARINNLPSMVLAAIISFHNTTKIRTGDLTHGPQDDSDATITLKDEHGKAIEKVKIKPGETINNLRGEYNVVHRECRE